MEWISVEDRLPEDGYEKLCYVIIPENGGGYFRTQKILNYSRVGKGWNCSGMIVTHWMSLPEPPDGQV